jgi:SpoVK/Ycf46/Vps4 family AAA+-type ATPase
MARSDLLLSLVKAGVASDQTLFRKTVEALIAEERARNHSVLAGRLAEQLSRNGSPPRPGGAPAANGTVQDLFYEVTPQRSIGDLILPEPVQQACAELVEEHHRTDLLRSHNLSPRNRVLLAGPPGNGKTSLAESLAHALMVPFIVVRYEGLIASYLGETASRLKRLFDYVRTRSCALFFDEFDTLGKERGDLHETGEIKRVVSSLLLQIDALPSYVVVITATNHPELLDRAVWRRFQLRLKLPPPTPAFVEKYLDHMVHKMNLSLGVSARTVVEKLSGANYSELEDFLCDFARRYVLSLPSADGKQIVTQLLRQWESRVGPEDNG